MSAAAFTAQESEAPPSEREVGRSRVLLVDDDPGLRASLARALGASRHEIVTAASAAEALKLLEAERFDVLCTDERMPEMRGSELLAIVKERHPDVVRIILTGFAELDVVIRVVNDIGIFRFLTKPCLPSDLMNVFDQAVTAREQGRRDQEAAAKPLVGDTSASEERFERGLSRLWLATQPIVSVANWGVFGYEAFVRSDEPTLPTPKDLFGLAGSLGRVEQLESAIRVAAVDLSQRLPDGCALFLNIEPRTLSDETLYEVGSALSAHADSIVLEITERSSLEDVNDLSRRIRELRALGFRIAVDDLGAGYAGLNSLAELSPDIVKFDHTLVRDIHESPLRTRLLSSMVQLCNEIGILPVAEGVETTGEMRRLISIGCSLLQGFLFSRPGRPFPTPQWPAAW